MSRKQHELKIIPEYFEAIVKGEKNFEVRLNDRNRHWWMYFPEGSYCFCKQEELFQRVSA